MEKTVSTPSTVGSNAVDPRLLGAGRLQAPQKQNFIVAVIDWYRFGLKVIPIVPGKKTTAVKWDPWLDALSEEKIRQHWTEHPDHELGFIVGDELIVFDADTPESLARLYRIEESHEIKPLLVVKTAKGEHHYFRRPKDVYAKSDAHDSNVHPDRLDVKTGRALIVLPPSTGKSIKVKEVDHASELTAVTQAFVDSVFLLNEREAPRRAEPVAAIEGKTPADLKEIAKLLGYINPDCGYEDWTRALMAIFHETGGSQEGLELGIRWSSRGSKFKGRAEIEAKWRSFKLDVARPCTLGTLIKLAREGGYNDEFDDEGYEVVQAAAVLNQESSRSDDIVDLGPIPADVPVQAAVREPIPPLARYSLRGQTAELTRLAGDEVLILGRIAMMGHFSVFFAKPNTGKTLIVLHLLIEAIKINKINPDNVYYINMDDNSDGLAKKNALADEYGFHMIADGHKDFKLSAFSDAVLKMIEEDQARGVVLILDTLKKFVDVMNKSKSSSFAKFVRRFVLKGGTVIALAHTNKNPDAQGRPVHAGTSDIVDDSDCAYTIREVSVDEVKKLRVVEFTNFKRRGNVVSTAAYRYSLENGIGYDGLLLSVEEVMEVELQPLKEEAELKSDAPAIEAIQSCISKGINTKMKIAAAASDRAKVSRRAALQVIEKYTGDNPETHKWKSATGQRGAQIYSLLEESTTEDIVTI